MAPTYSRHPHRTSKRAGVRRGAPVPPSSCENRDVSRPVPFVHPIGIRYLEVDRQGVVFNMWYLAYLDDAMTAFLSAGGFPYSEMLAVGYDAQVVHTEVDWHGPLGFGDPAAVHVRVSHLGRTSFTLGFQVVSSTRVVASATTVYVVVRTDGSGKCVPPPALLDALGPVTATVPST
jgi:acyl-CoA thioester hydrolase